MDGFVCAPKTRVCQKSRYDLWYISATCGFKTEISFVACRAVYWAFPLRLCVLSPSLRLIGGNTWLLQRFALPAYRIPFRPTHICHGYWWGRFPRSCSFCGCRKGLRISRIAKKHTQNNRMAVKDQANISVDYWLCRKYSHFFFRFQVSTPVFAMKTRLETSCLPISAVGAKSLPLIPLISTDEWGFDKSFFWTRDLS